ncbi:MAG: glycosyltransferase [Nocardioides sp.]
MSGAAAQARLPASRYCTSSARRAADPGPTHAPYVVVPFVDRMDLAYAAADLVVCRAGANSVTRPRPSACRRSSSHCRSETASRS